MYNISLIIPCYNREKTISITLDSVINQTMFKDMEVICVDDCSKDNTIKVIENYTKKFPNIKLIKNKVNSGTYFTRKNGILNSTAPYIAHLDADDWVEPGFYEELYNIAIKNNYNYVITKSVMAEYGNNKAHACDWGMPEKVNPNTLVELKPGSDSSLLNNYFVWNGLFKKDILKPYLSLPNARIIYAEDILMITTAMITNKGYYLVQTKSKHHYYLGDDVEHVSTTETPEQKKNAAKSMSLAWALIDTYLMEYNKLDYLPLLKQYRKSGIEKLSQKYTNLFNLETFISKKSNKVLFRLTKEDKRREANEIRKRIEFLQAEY